MVEAMEWLEEPASVSVASASDLADHSDFRFREVCDLEHDDHLDDGEDEDDFDDDLFGDDEDEDDDEDDDDDDDLFDDDED